MSSDPAADRAPRRPSLGLFVTEPGRAAYDAGALVVGAVPLLLAAPRGDGHPVLVLPGLLASDTSTLPLRRFLRRQGFHVHGWRLGRNLGPTPAVVQGMRDRLEALAQRHGRPISLVGWSLGGIYARRIAERAPSGAIRQVITLGSPYRLAHPDQSRAHTTFARLRHRHTAGTHRLPPLAEWRRLPVPATSVYSRLDGVVRWETCVEPPGPLSENVEVRASHLGLGVSPAVLLAVADRLAQPDGRWEPFRPPWFARHLYPRPA